MACHGLIRFLFLSTLGFAAAQKPDSAAPGLISSSEGGFPTFIGVPRTAHPNYRIFSLTPDGYAFKVTGMDWMANGDLAVLTIGDTVFPEEGGGLGSVYRLKGVKEASSNSTVQVEQIYSGFKVPMGLAVADDSIYVSDFDGLEKLVDRDHDGKADSLEKVVAYPGKSTVGLGLWNANVIHSGNDFYTALGAYHYVDSAYDSGACKPEADRGTIHKTDKAGKVEFLGSGLREPNGLVVASDGELFATDNDGEWVPSNKLVHIRKEAFYGMCVGTRWDPALIFAPPAIWFPHLLRSPGQPVVIPSGIYKDQMVVGDYALLTLSRLFLEKVGGEYQGALFPFSGGMISGALRLAGDDAGNLYMGEIEIESTEGWWYEDTLYRPTHIGYGLQKMSYQGDSAFEMLAVRATSKGFSIDFTLPVGESAAAPANYRIQQWRYEPTFNYGGPMLDLETLSADQASVSPDGRTVTLDISGLKQNRVVHIQLRKDFRSLDGKLPWAYETWYTLNAIPGQTNEKIRPMSGAAANPFRISGSGFGRTAIAVSLREKYVIDIWNMRGRRVLSSQGNGPRVFILGAADPPGVYPIIIRAGGHSYQGRICHGWD